MHTASGKCCTAPRGRLKRGTRLILNECTKMVNLIELYDFIEMIIQTI